MRLRALLLALAMALGAAAPAAAHKLKVYATVSGDAITGYAFFIGGGRALATPWTATDAGGAEIAHGETDGEGRFRLVPPKPVATDIIVTVDTREGHVASATVAASRFGAAGSMALIPPAAAAETAAPAPAGMTANAAAMSADLVEAAVQRQVEPLLERLEAMDDRLRMSDVMSGIFLIVGLAGIGLWARTRRR